MLPTQPQDSAVPNVPNLSEKRQSPGDPQGISSAALSTLQGGGLWRKGAEPQRDPPAAAGHPAVKRQTRNSELVGEH